MKTAFLTIAAIGIACSLSGPQTIEPADAANIAEPISVVDRSAEVAALQAELETLRTELAAAKSAPPVVQPVSVSAPARAVCASGNCGQPDFARRAFVQQASEPRRFQPLRRVFGRRR